MAERTGTRYRWGLGVAIVVVWVLGWVGLQTIVFDGDPLAAAVQGAAGGAAFAVVFVALQRREPN